MGMNKTHWDDYILYERSVNGLQRMQGVCLCMRMGSAVVRAHGAWGPCRGCMQNGNAHWPWPCWGKNSSSTMAFAILCCGMCPRRLSGVRLWPGNGKTRHPPLPAGNGLAVVCSGHAPSNAARCTKGHCRASPPQPAPLHWGRQLSKHAAIAGALARGTRGLIALQSRPAAAAFC
jgi:hypothetical protein